MKCEERFYDYIDYVKGKLPLNITLEIDKHILSCNKCKEEIKNIKSFTLTLDNFNIKEPDEGYFVNLVPIINEKIESKKRKLYNEKYSVILSIVSVIIFAVTLVFTYGVSNTQISTQTFVGDELISSIDNYTLFSYTTYDDTDNNVQQIFAEAIAGLLLHDYEDLSSSQENVKLYLASFSDDELNNIIDELKNRHISN